MLVKKISTLFLIILCSFSYGQSFLALDKRGKVKRIRFLKSDYIALMTKNDSLVAGSIESFNDSSFVVSNELIKLSQIKYIHSPKPNHGLKLISKLSYIAGVGYFTLDSGNRIINNEKPFIQNSALKTSAIFIGIGSIFSIVSSRKYRINKKHPIKIIDLTIN